MASGIMILGEDAKRYEIIVIWVLMIISMLDLTNCRCLGMIGIARE